MMSPGAALICIGSVCSTQHIATATPRVTRVGRPFFRNTLFAMTHPFPEDTTNASRKFAKGQIGQTDHQRNGCYEQALNRRKREERGENAKTRVVTLLLFINTESRASFWHTLRSGISDRRQDDADK